MIGVGVEIRRFVDDSFPGWVECTLTDAQGCEWSFVEKVPVVTTSALDSNSSYPQLGVIACRIIGRKVDATGHEILTIDTETPCGIQSATGQTCFELLREHLVEF